MSSGSDLDAITARWLRQCGAHDGGVPGSGSCLDDDPRPVIAELVAEVERARGELTRLKETAERFGDPTVTDHIARILRAAPPVNGCPWCRGTAPSACARHGAEALVEAMRAEHLVVVTVEVADQIIRVAAGVGAR